jgi:hypothetical protein
MTKSPLLDCQYHEKAFENAGAIYLLSYFLKGVLVHISLMIGGFKGSSILAQ